MFGTKEKVFHERIKDLDAKICTNSTNLANIEKKVDKVTNTIDGGLNTFNTGYKMVKWVIGFFSVVITSGFFGSDVIKFIRNILIDAPSSPQSTPIIVSPQSNTVDSTQILIQQQSEIIELLREQKQGDD